MATFHFEVGSWVWITDEEERYLPAKVLSSFAAGEATTVLTEDGEKRKLDALVSKEVTQCNPEALSSGIDDLVSISDLNEMAILHNLRIRYKEDKIYTNISSILISVNPFKLLPLYTPEVLDHYRSGYRGKAPHVFGIAYNAYNNMLADSNDQSVVISGESGAGKSEATKLILQFLTDLSARSTNASTAQGTQSKSSLLEQQILAANPILEAFGNAKTLRNNNSSRFGKLITVNFDSNGGIMGGGIINYLLEKSRVVGQTQGERNYHIFYQLLSAADTDPVLSERMKLQNPELFEYTGRSGVISVDGISDEKDFEEMQNSMDILRFGDNMKDVIFAIVAGVLHFGNVKFKAEKKDTAEDAAFISNPEVADHASAMWGVDPALINKFLCSKNIGTREVILTTFNLNQALDARDAMVKRVYVELFQIIVNQVNKELSSGNKKRHKFIGVLDIFGFESFVVNSFEQLCINFCNEKLQFHFNEHIFRMEQELYAAEGIVIPGSSFVDNQPTLDLLAAARTGVFAMCDEEINVPRGSDDGFLKKVLTKHADGHHPNCVRPKARECHEFLKCFGILHYAGAVYYNVTGFLDKNKDTLGEDICTTLRGSSIPLVSSMFPAPVADTGGKKKGGKVTLGGQFKTQLDELIKTLNSTYPHFVRCMKPNDEKIGNVFTASRMQDQLRYAGLVEVCRIRKLGYPVRRSFEEFYKRFKCINLLSTNLDALLKSLSEKGILHAGEWAKGNTKVFMRTAQGADLEAAREASLLEVTVKIQKVARGFIWKRKYKYYKVIFKAIRDAMATRTEKALKEALDMAGELPHQGVHLKDVQEAKVLYARVKEENRVLALLQSALDSMELNTLKQAVQTCGAMKPAFDPPILGKVNEAIKKLEAEMACKAALAKAIDAKDLAALTAAIEQAGALNYKCSELDQAITLKAKIEEQNKCLAELAAATAARDLDKLNAISTKAIELGVDGRAEFAAAATVIAAINEENAKSAAAAAEAQRQKEAMEAAQVKRKAEAAAAEKDLQEAMASGDRERVALAVKSATQMGLAGAVFDSAETMLKAANSSADVKTQLQAAIKVLQVKAETGIVDSDIAPLTVAIRAAEGLKMAELGGDIASAKEAKSTYEQHVTAKAQLLSAVSTKDRKELRAAMDLAENLDLNLEIMTQAKDILRELENAYRADKAAGNVADDKEPYDAAEEARKQRQELAKQARFDVKNFPGLRSSDDFARGAILNKGKVKDCFLSFQSMVIPKSLLDLNKDNNKLAMQIHKDLLGYMGDKQMPFPAMLAQDILRKGYEYKPIRDEIYLQIIKQLTSNPRPESVAKGWQIMCMCVGTFPPSFDFENFLLHYIIEKRDRGRGAVVDYARYCLRTLEAMLSNGDGTGFVPSVEEILAYKERPPILATIHLVDGNVITEDLPITPDLNVGKVLEMCSGWLDLKDPRVDSLGVFVYDLGESDDSATMDESYKTAVYRDLIRTPRPLRNDDFMGDIIVQRARQRRKFKFVLKKKIFLPQHNGRGSDPFYERLVYLQAEDETIIQGNIDMDDEEKVAGLAGISMAVAFGEDMGATPADLVEANVIDFVVPSWRPKKGGEDWADLILQSRDALVTADPEDLQDQFLQIVQESPLYGMHWFYVYKVETPASVMVPAAVRSLPRQIMLGYNAEGMHVYSMTRQLLVSFPYADIYRWGGSSSQFSLIMADPSMPESFEFVIITGQAADMAAIILDHIRAIMAEQEAQDEG